MLSTTFVLLSLVPLGFASAIARDAQASASSYAGAPATFNYPPTGTAVPTTYFPDEAQVGYAGPTPSAFECRTLSLSTYLLVLLTAGDEAAAIETAPSIAKVDTVYPLVAPAAADKSAKQFDVTKHWGNLSPMQSVDSFGLPHASPEIPQGCGLNQVHLLHRHGARYPTTGGTGPAAFAAKLNAAASGAGFAASGAMEFLNTWTYKLGAEILTPFGREQL